MISTMRFSVAGPSWKKAEAKGWYGICRWKSLLGFAFFVPGIALANVEAGVAAYVQGDYETAVHEWQSLARSGETDALHNMAILYLEGRGVERNVDQGVALLRQAANHGGVESQLELAGLYESGAGVKQDLEQAVAWYRQAAESGSAIGGNNLGRLYALGEGVEKTPREAVRWFSKAARQGLKQARDNLLITLDTLEQKEVRVRGANVREGGSTRFPVIDWMAQGERVSVLGESGGWSEVYDEGAQTIGWISSRLLDPISAG